MNAPRLTADPRDPSVAPVSRGTFHALLDAFLEELKLRGRSPHTLRAYDTDLHQLLTSLAGQGHIRPSDVPTVRFSTDGVRTFLGELNARGNSRSSAARRLAAFRTFARYLVREGLIADDPTALIGAPRQQRGLPEYLAADETTKLLEAPDTATLAGRRDRAILELFYASGLRLSELVDLDLEDVPDHVRSLFTAKPEQAPSLTGESPLRPILGTRSVLTSVGERHMRQRKLLLPPFHGEAIDRYTEMIDAATAREIDKWPVGKPFALAPRMQAITLDVIMAAIFGIEGRPKIGTPEYGLRDVRVD